MDTVDWGKLSKVKIQTMEKETHTEPIDVENKNDSYVGMLSTNKSSIVTDDKYSWT